MLRRLAPLLVFLSVAAAAQPTTLEGTVTDAETGRPLPGATAQATDGVGEAADREGRFRLRLDTLPATVVVRFVGYRPDTLRIARDDVPADGIVRRTVRLRAAPVELGEVQVTDENPAVNILRQVLARKATLKRQMPEYAFEAYTRFTLERWGLGETFGTVVRVTEALSNGYWRMGGGSREEVVARRRIPAGPPFRYAAAEAVPDLFFDDWVDLDGARYPTPTHPEALARYDVRLGEVVEQDGLRYYDIAIAPRRMTPGLAGRLRVVDSLFVLAEAELRPAFRPGQAFEAFFEATYRVTFAPVVGNVWLPSRFEREGQVAAAGVGVRIPEARFRQTTLVTTHRPGGSGPPALWAYDDRYYSPAHVFGGEEIYRPYRILLPLTEDEEAALARGADLDLSDLFWHEGLAVQLSFLPVSRFLLPVAGADDPVR